MTLKEQFKRETGKSLDGTFHGDNSHNVADYISWLEAKVETIVIRHIDDWHEDIGPCLWWEDMDSAMGEPAQYIGSPICCDWPSYLRNGDAVFVPHPRIRVE